MGVILGVPQSIIMQPYHLPAQSVVSDPSYPPRGGCHHRSTPRSKNIHSLMLPGITISGVSPKTCNISGTFLRDRKSQSSLANNTERKYPAPEQLRLKPQCMYPRVFYLIRNRSQRIRMMYLLQKTIHRI